jgi:hypothetical protein
MEEGLGDAHLGIIGTGRARPQAECTTSHRARAAAPCSRVVRVQRRGAWEKHARGPTSSVERRAPVLAAATQAAAVVS